MIDKYATLKSAVYCSKRGARPTFKERSYTCEETLEIVEILMNKIDELEEKLKEK